MSVTVNQWATQGACRGSDPDALFVQGAAQNRAKAICFSCPVRTECLADALDHRIEFGVWGGMTEREQRPGAEITARVDQPAGALRAVQTGDADLAVLPWTGAAPPAGLGAAPRRGVALGDQQPHVEVCQAG